MRALALSHSITFSALILVLSLGPLGANVVRYNFSVREYAILTHRM